MRLIEIFLNKTSGGVILDFAYGNVIFKNNFIRNNFTGLFRVDYTNVHGNKWKKNFYGFRFSPKIIGGVVRTKFYWEDPDGHHHNFFRPGINIDWRPAFLSYNIEV